MREKFGQWFLIRQHRIGATILMTVLMLAVVGSLTITPGGPSAECFWDGNQWVCQ